MTRALGVHPADDGLIRIPSGAATLDGFRAWARSDHFPETLRASFINREIVLDMSPEETETHNKVKTEVSRGIGTLIRGLDLGEFYGDGTLLTNPAAQLSTDPDALFVTWESFEAGRARLVPRGDRPGPFVELEGTPDWVLEVVSRTSVRKDADWLRDAYHRAGVPEYWLVDARFDPIAFTLLRRRRDRYVATSPRDGWLRSAVFGRRFRLDRQRNRAGRWTYTLHVGPS